MGTGRAFDKAGPDTETARLDPVFIFIREQQVYLNFWSVYIFSISVEQISQPDMPVGCLFGFGKLLRIF